MDLLVAAIHRNDTELIHADRENAALFVGIPCAMRQYMRVLVVASLLAGVFLTGAAGAAPARSASRKVAAHGSAKAVASSPSAFVKSGPAAAGAQPFKDASGAEWLGRPGKGDEHDVDRLGNEHVVSAIYRLAESTFGTTAPEVRFAKIDGKPFLLSKKIPLSETKTFTDEQLKRFADGFVIDAWLGSSDAGGAWQISVDAAGRPLRTEGTGGGLFRARGEPKGVAFADEVAELQSMRDPLRPASFAFRKLTEQDLKDQLQKFATWYPAHKSEVEAAIDGSVMSAASSATLKAKLAARAQWLVAQSKKSL